MLHALPVTADVAGVFTLGDRTEVRARYPDTTAVTTTQAVGHDVALDLDTLFDVRAVWAAPSTTYTLADQPRVTLVDFNNPAVQTALLDTALASVDWHWPHADLRVAESATYGKQTFGTVGVLPPAGTPQQTTTTGQTAPQPTAPIVPGTSHPIPYGASNTSATSTLRLRPWTLIATVGYQLSGGTDEVARDSLAFQQGPLAMAAADWSVDSRDHLRTVVTGSETSFSLPLGTEDVIVEADEQWRHRWGRSTDTLLAAGWYAARSRLKAGAPDTFGSGAEAEASLNQSFLLGGGARGQVRADVTLAPLVDPLTGTVEQQIRGTLDGSVTRRRVRLRAFASAGQTLEQNTSSSFRLLTAEVDAAYKVSESLTFDGGIRALYQEQVGALPPSITQGVLFFAVTVRAIKARF